MFSAAMRTTFKTYGERLQITLLIALLAACAANFVVVRSYSPDGDRWPDRVRAFGSGPNSSAKSSDGAALTSVIDIIDKNDDFRTSKSRKFLAGYADP